MKTIGLLGGMSWESTIVYYRVINEIVRSRLGGLHSARCILYSFDFDQVVAMQRAAAWADATLLLGNTARAIVEAGADLVLICTNTMHKMADAVQQSISVPLIHIADPTAQKIRASHMRTVGLLATRFTMEEDFYVGRLTGKHGLSVLVPPEDDRQAVHDIIFDELCRGRICDESRRRLVKVIQDLAARGAESAILGCTELGLLIGQQDSLLPLFDTTLLHAEAAVDLALA